MSFNIRKAIAGDIASLQKLAECLNDFRTNNFLPENRQFHSKIVDWGQITMENLQEDIFLLAENQNGEIAGYVWGSLYEKPEHTLSKFGYIEEIFVQNQYRGTGLGKLLLSALEKEFSKLNCQAMSTITDFENQLSQPLYKSFGMQPVSVEFFKEIDSPHKPHFGKVKN